MQKEQPAIASTNCMPKRRHGRDIENSSPNWIVTTIASFCQVLFHIVT
jgi:hypothetical protein